MVFGLISFFSDRFLFYFKSLDLTLPAKKDDLESEIEWRQKALMLIIDRFGSIFCKSWNTGGSGRFLENHLF